MVKRINKKLVTFQFPFSIDDIGKQLPAGEYTIESEEESIVGLSFLAYRHIETILVERPPKGKPGATHYWSVDHEALAKAIEADSDRFLESKRTAASARQTSSQETENE
ncbi:MAG: hypothetical protein JJ919_17925 [Henriciella sp.]|nr:hypothetical protein [Henriciella sp.]